MTEPASTPQTDPIASLPEGVEARTEALTRMLAEEGASVEVPDLAKHFEDREQPAKNDNDDAAKPANTNADPSANDNGAPTDDVRKRLQQASEIERKVHTENKRLSEYRAKLDADRAYVEAEKQDVARLKTQLQEQEKRFQDPAFLLPWLRKNVEPGKLAEHLAEEMNPSVAAEWAARRAASEESPAFKEAMAKIAALEERDRKRQEEQEQAQKRTTADTHRQASVDRFMSTIGDDSPLVAALAKHSKDELVRRADAVADRLVAQHGSASYNQVKLELEKELQAFRDIFASPSTPATEPAKADRARTLTAGNSAGRSSIADKSAHMSADERARELKRLLGG